MFDEFDTVAVGVAAEQRGTAGTAAHESMAGALQTADAGGEVVHHERHMAVAPDMTRPALDRIRIRHFEQVDLMPAHRKPGTGIAEVGTRHDRKPEQIAVEGERPLRIRHDDAHMMKVAHPHTASPAARACSMDGDDTTLFRPLRRPVRHADLRKRPSCFYNLVGARAGIAYAVRRGIRETARSIRPAQGMLDLKQTQTYRVTAFYEHPELERNAVVQADSIEQAMVKAVLERKVPVGFTRDEYGWIQPVFWKTEMGGERRWPRVVGRDRLAWGDADAAQTLRFDVEEA